MTWQEFKQEVQNQGTLDTDEIEFIDIHGTADFKVVCEEPEAAPRRIYIA